MAVFAIFIIVLLAAPAGPVRLRNGAEGVMTVITDIPTSRETDDQSLRIAGVAAVPRRVRAGDDPALRQQRLLGADRHARRDLLGAGRPGSISWSASPASSPSAMWRC